MSRRAVTATVLVPVLVAFAFLGPLACEEHAGGLWGKAPFGFTDIRADLPGLSACSLAWGDYDSDGDLDLVIAGQSDAGPVSTIYRNDEGQFVITALGLTGMYSCSLAWGDYDSDGDLDLVIAGRNSSNIAVSKIYENRGAVDFNPIGAGLMGVEDGDVAWGDYDNDGDLDLAIVGSGTARIYQNDAGTFTDIGAGLVGVSSGCSVVWGDYDNDGDLDLALSGRSSSSGAVSKIYQNNAGIFADSGAMLTGVEESSLASGDYDSDGNLDLVVAGSEGSFGASRSMIYRNEGGGNVNAIGVGLMDLWGCSAAWGDFDSDGDLDLALAGAWDAWDDMGVMTSHPKTLVYRNDSGMDEFGFRFDSFEDVRVKLTGVVRGSLAWGDYDNDGDLDLAVAGQSDTEGICKVYSGDSDVYNNPPSPPTGLRSIISGTNVTFYWDPASDTETDMDGLTYNLRVGRMSGRDDVMPGMSLIDDGGALDGKRLVAAMGNVQHNTRWMLKGLAQGVYFWSVQAVDSGFAGSVWADEEALGIGDTVLVISPNGGEMWDMGGQVTVEWTTTGAVGNVKIELSTNGGITWPTTLVASTFNDGSETITVPNTPSVACRVRVSDEIDGSLSDMSDTDFAIAPGPVAYWNFDEGAGTTAMDSSGNGNNGAINGAQWASGISGNALSFDGVDDYVRVTSAASLRMTQACTIQAWITISPGTQYAVDEFRHVLSKGATDLNLNSDYAVGLSNPGGAVLSEFSTSGNDYKRTSAGLPLSQGEWHFVAATFDVGEVALYVDGSPVGTETLDFTTLRASNQPIYIGCRYISPMVGNFDGLIDEVKIYNYARTAEQIASDAGASP